MIDVKNIRKDFPMLNGKTQQGHPLVYFDNAATTFKPQSVIDACDKYYSEETANAHRGDYDLAFKVDKEVDLVREKVANFIGAKKQEVIKKCALSFIQADGDRFQSFCFDVIAIFITSDYQSKIRFIENAFT